MKSFCPREVPLNSLFVQYDDVNCFAQGKDSCIVVDPLFKYVIKRVALFFIHFSDLYHKAFRCLDDVNCFAQVKDSCIVVDPQFKYAIESFAQGRRALHCLKSTFPIFHKKIPKGGERSPWQTPAVRRRATVGDLVSSFLFFFCSLFRSFKRATLGDLVASFFFPFLLLLHF